MTIPLSLFRNSTIATDPAVDAALAAHSPVAIGVSGGKDSSAVALATIDYLDSIGHTGPRILIHADLGMTEWRSSQSMCADLARRLGLELVVVRRTKGGMMERWEQRWADNVARYAALSCVQLILPWSTPGMRFCTSELKVAPICRELARRFPGETTLSVTGIRRQESAGRAKAPISQVQNKLTRTKRGTSGLDWHPILDWSLADVFSYLEEKRSPLHEAYTKYGASRVSCAYCIMSARADLMAATVSEENHALYRRMVALESSSTFAFQGNGWLADVAPHLLTDEIVAGVNLAKAASLVRVQAEKRIGKHLRYTKGWPTCIPTKDEAELLADVRLAVSDVVGLKINFTKADEIIGRYHELMAAKKAA